MPRSPAASVLLTQLEQLIGEVLGLEHPADAVISRFFRSHPKLGMRDRAFLADGAWMAVRHRTWFSHLSASGLGPINRRYALLAACQVLPPEAVDPLASPEERQWLTHVRLLEQTPLALTIRQSIPGWIFDAWTQAIGQQESEACAVAANEPAPLDLRVNTIKAKPAAVMDALTQEGVTVRAAGVLPEALRVEGKPALQKTHGFLQGWFEVQDLGSQILARLVGAKRGQFVVDLCAGAGGKTLALGALMRNTGRLYALDVSAGRLASFKPRLIRSGLSNVWPSAISGLSDERLKRLTGKADAVLVDAPCSGTGTLRRNPDLKWRQSPQSIDELVEQQGQILEAAARLLKPSGRLVYATCSLLEQENQAVVARFLADHPSLRRVLCEQVLKGQGVDLPEAWRAFTADGDLWLWPHRTGTDGFYAAVFEGTGHQPRGVG